MSISVCFVASKSGGHLLPCLTLARGYKKENPQIRTTLMCGTSITDTSVVKDCDAIDSIFSLEMLTFNKRAPWTWPKFAWQSVRLFFHALRILKYTESTYLISTGGVIAIPVALAAYFLGIPLELYELNAIPGKAVKVLAPLAATIKICFPPAQQFFSQKTSVASYPLAVTTLPKSDDIYKKLGFDPLKKTIFIMGGSQGSRFINNQFLEWVLHNRTAVLGLQIIHQTGVNNFFDWQYFYEQQKITAYVFDFCKNVGSYYAIANLVICRAGAGTLFELKEFKIPALVIPLPKRVSEHQRANAYAMKEMVSHIVVIDQEEIEKKNSSCLGEVIDQFLNLSKN